MAELSGIIQTLRELQRMHQLNLELIEELNIIFDWIEENKLSIPNKEKFYSLLFKTRTLLQELYNPKRTELIIQKSTDEILQGKRTDEDLTEPARAIYKGGIVFSPAYSPQQSGSHLFGLHFFWRHYPN